MLNTNPIQFFMKQIFIVLHLTFLALAAQGQAEFAAVDARARSFQKSSYKTPEALAVALCKDLKSDSEKARAIFTWIATNVRYKSVNDPSADSQKEYGEKLALQAFRGGKGVCMHYAYLYKTMAEAVGLECVFIGGKSRRDVRGSGGSHAWNAVKIKGQWALLDVTWGASFQDNKGVFQQVFRPGYFGTNPRIFIQNHIPDEAKWQLLDPPLDKSQIQQYPVFDYGDLQHDIQDAEPFGTPLKKGSDGYITLKIKLQDPAPVIQLEHKGRKIASTRTDQNGWVSLRFKPQGLQEVEVWGGKQVQEKGKSLVRTNLMGVFPVD